MNELMRLFKRHFDEYMVERRENGMIKIFGESQGR
jgi:hypothetical protein